MTETQELQISIASDKVSFRGAGGAEHAGAPGFDDDLFATLARLRSEGVSQDYGHELFRATFLGDLEEEYKRERHEVEQAGARWRLRFDIPEDEQQLQALWWECLFDDRPTRKPLATLGSTLVSRHLSRDDVEPALEAERLRMLLVIASPHDLGRGRWDGIEPLNEARERRIVEEALEGLDDVVDVDVLTEGASLGRIRRRLRDDSVNILHVVAHASFDDEAQKDYLLLETDEGEETVEENVERLSQLVDGLPNLRLVVLSAGENASRPSVDPFVRLAPKMVYSGVNAVVAMQDLMSGDLTSRFVKHFFRSLLTSKEADGMVDAAMTIARDELFFNTRQGGWDWAVPVLYMRGEGRLFAPVAGGEPVARAPSAKPAASEATAAAPARSRREPERAPVPEAPGGQRQSLPSLQRAFLIDHMKALEPAEFESTFEELCFVLEIPAEELTGSPVARVIALIRRCEDEGKVESLADRIRNLDKAQRLPKQGRAAQDVIVKYKRTAIGMVAW